MTGERSSDIRPLSSRSGDCEVAPGGEGAATRVAEGSAGEAMNSVIVVINGKLTRVSEDWVWENCDGEGGRKTVDDFKLLTTSTHNLASKETVPNDTDFS